MIGEEGAPNGTIEFRRCEIATIIYSGVWGRWDPNAPTKLKFTECSWRDVARNHTVAPLQFEIVNSGTTGAGGGIEFVNSSLYDEYNRDPMILIADGLEQDTLNIFGNINIFNETIAETATIVMPHCPQLLFNH